MKLLLDIGNSRVKWALSGATLAPGVSVGHAGRALELALAEIRPAAVPEEIWAASVASLELRTVVEAWANRQFGLPVTWVASRPHACGVHNAYADPARLGVDRWLAVIAGHARLQASEAGVALVVDAGTALTLDAVDRGGRHLGGLIAPGLATQRQSVRRQTQVRAEEVRAAIPALLAQDTDAAVAWGTYHGVTALIERIYTGICREHANVLPLLTGGDAQHLRSGLAPEWELASDLVLEGLQRVAAEGKNQQFA
jgi:type III pantothenate kinase